MLEQQTLPPYIHREPIGPASPFIFAAPHSGRHYPADFKVRSTLDEDTLRKSEDAFVDQLFEDVPNSNASLLVATYARAYLDLNRADNELDPKMFTPHLDNADLNVSHRVQAGLGIIPRFVAEDTAIYCSLLPAREAEKRISSVHKPYHSKLAQLIKASIDQHSIMFLIDCHSMPSDIQNTGRKSATDPDIILGDCWGTACMRDLTDIAETLFLSAGLTVRRNVPYSGGYSTSWYGNPKINMHALQIEINRGLYMDEATLSPLPQFDTVKQIMADFSRALVKRVSNLLPEKINNARAAE